MNQSRNLLQKAHLIKRIEIITESIKFISLNRLIHTKKLLYPSNKKVLSMKKIALGLQSIYPQISYILYPKDILEVSLIIFGIEEGLSGSANNTFIEQLMFYLNDLYQKYTIITLYIKGKKTLSSFNNQKSYNLQIEYFQSTNDLIDKIIEREIKYYIIYFHFFSNINQVVQCTSLDLTVKEKTNRKNYVAQYLAEDKFDLNLFLRFYVASHLDNYQLHSYISELSCRFNSMKSASESAATLAEEYKTLARKSKQIKENEELNEIASCIMN
jgi:F0F1-type ATP synthase gamma subunit